MQACIVTCGGLCPGLNTVIREIVYSLDYMYGVKRVLGIDVSDLWLLFQFLALLLNFELRYDSDPFPLRCHSYFSCPEEK